MKRRIVDFFTTKKDIPFLDNNKNITFSPNNSVISVLLEKDTRTDAIVDFERIAPYIALGKRQEKIPSDIDKKLAAKAVVRVLASEKIPDLAEKIKFLHQNFSVNLATLENNIFSLNSKYSTLNPNIIGDTTYALTNENGQLIFTIKKENPKFTHNNMEKDKEEAIGATEYSVIVHKDRFELQKFTTSNEVLLTELNKLQLQNPELNIKYNQAKQFLVAHKQALEKKLEPQFQGSEGQSSLFLRSLTAARRKGLPVEKSLNLNNGIDFLDTLINFLDNTHIEISNRLSLIENIFPILKEIDFEQQDMSPLTEKIKEILNHPEKYDAIAQELLSIIKPEHLSQP